MTRSLDGAVYNEVVDAWMIPQADPYTLANFQAAYDKLAAGKSTQTLSKAQAAEFTPTKKLAPTHYALKIYPKTEEEQWRVEMMEDVQVAYIPFDWVQLTPQEAEKAEQSKTRSAANTFPEKSPYTVTYENYESTAGGPTPPRTSQLPILYTVWPVEKPLPNDLEYEVDYEVFLPHKAVDILSADAMQSLRSEAAPHSAIALPSVTRSSAANYTWPLAGSVTTNDDQAGNVPMVSLKISYHDGSYMVDASTGYDGKFVLSLLADTPLSSSTPPVTVYLTYTYQDLAGRWKITPENSTVPCTNGSNTTFTVRPSSSGAMEASISLSSTNRQLNEIHRAATYFYSQQTKFPKTSIPSGLTIEASSGLSSLGPTIGGELHYSDTDDFIPYVVIYNTGITNGNSDKHPFVMGSTLHELGHNLHYWDDRSIRGNANNYRKTPQFLRDSYANYVGWLLGEDYYASHGWLRPTGWVTQSDQRNLDQLDITLCARQKWTMLSDRYNPLFVDMTDLVSQHTYPGGSYYYLHDFFENMTPAQIRTIINTSTEWSQVRSKLQTNMLNMGHTQTEIDTYFNDYNAWFIFNN